VRRKLLESCEVTSPPERQRSVGVMGGSTPSAFKGVTPQLASNFTEAAKGANL
jgi:hypothetical protein